MPLSISASPIVSQAFRFLEMSSISGFGDDSDEARAAAECYPIALKACLEHADWSFASVVQMLVPAELPLAAGADPDLPWFYHLPEGMIRLIEVGDGDGFTRWRRDAEGLRSDDPGPLRVRFTRAITSEAMLPATFQTAVAYHLAALMAPRYGLPMSKQDRLEQGAEVQLRRAASKDGRQASSERYDGQPDWGDWATEATR